ncbi:hypothetical protein A8F94_14895 [Bacillus sp. FJAT-27225]|uniref:tetratricopeptide repeat protein n=1 Tax=Bacillus sp. FJAT-27225 TaxID=1743144 RepID=UPI00080C2D76|nr:hypothetical protein [Bacillus sp. FJAT-27225]OCA84021.1 hypothetical protein A8F94_14895 [Bacillus sp. FJAT-27225]
MELIFIFGLGWILFLIYSLYIKPVKTYEHVISRGFFNRVIGLKKKEKQLYLNALQNMSLSENERRDLMFIIGNWYAKNNNWSEAIHYYNNAFQNYNENFHYKKEFHRVIDCYIECNEKEQAKEVLKFFLKRKSFDENYRKLEKEYKDLLV